LAGGRSWGFEKMEHVFGCLLGMTFGGERGKWGSLFGEEIDSENVAFGRCIRETALVASAMFRRGTNVPTDLAMLAKCGTRFGTDVGHNSGARRSNWRSIEVAVAKE
jgi:hypothetical protein